MPRIGCTILTASLAMVAAGCAGSGAGLDANGNPISPGSGSTEPLTADFQSIQDNVFTPICTRCHIGAGAPQGLQLDAAHSYALLVGVPSTEQPNVLRVKPGDPDSSYLIHKLEGSAGITGVQMPFGGPYLPQSTIDVIREWISAGAMQSMATAMSAASQRAQPLSVSATEPTNDSVETTAQPRIVVAFNREVDSSLVNNTTIVLERARTSLDTSMSSMASTASVASMASATSVTSTTIPITITTAAGNPATLLITPRIPLARGLYRLTLRGTGAAALADLSAKPLGIDYSFTFTVDDSQ